MRTLRIFLIFAMLFSSVSLVCAAEDRRMATIKEVSGSVDVRLGSAAFAPAQSGMILSQGDTIRTKANSFVVLDLDKNGRTATLELKENSQLTLTKLLGDDKKATQTTLLDLALGEIMIKAQKLHSEKSRFEVKTPTSIVAVRGTTFSVAVEAVE